MRYLFIIIPAALLLLAGCALVKPLDGPGTENGYTQITQERAREMMARDDGHIVVDVRRRDEYEEEHIPGAVCIPNESITDSLPDEISDPDRIILVYCRSGRRSKEAAQKLFDMGCKNVYEFGGIIDWTGDTVKKYEEDTVILSEPDPTACGGTTRTQDRNAPGEIKSETVTLFSAYTALRTLANGASLDGEPLQFISAYAARCGEGALVYLETVTGYDERKRAFALTDGAVLEELAAFVKEFELVKNNGYDSFTHGLPEDFGGEVYVSYDGGERIKFSDNQSPVLTGAACERLAAVMTAALSGGNIPLTDPSRIAKIRSFDSFGDGYVNTELVFSADGGHIVKDSCYENKNVFKNERDITPAAAEEIRALIAKYGVLAWADLPGTGAGEDKRLEFELDDGSVITVRSGRRLPDYLASGFNEITRAIER